VHNIQADQNYQLLPARRVRELISVSPMTLYRLYTHGDLPDPIKINNRNFWRLADIQSWIDQR
jgi:predicted DNA-binding transcriptional regulator AlpA